MRRILRWLKAQVGMVAESLLGTLETLAELDLVHVQARLSNDYRMSAPHLNQEGRLVLRAARHPLLEALFRGDPAVLSAPPRNRRRRPIWGRVFLSRHPNPGRLCVPRSRSGP